MPIYVAMLRGINVSGQKIIKMEELRATFRSLGFHDVRSYIQSGNIIFKSVATAPSTLGKQIPAAIQRDFGFQVSALIRTPKELGDVLKRNPFSKQKGADDAKMFVTFLSQSAPKPAAATLKPLATQSEQFQVIDREIHVYCPEGYGKTKLSNNAIEKALSLAATSRSLKTVRSLFALTKESSECSPT